MNPSEFTGKLILAPVEEAIKEQLWSKTDRDVYFIQVGKSGPIKIGNSRDPGRRLEQLQQFVPWELRLLATMWGGAEAERDIHNSHAQGHIRGEWFRPSYKLLFFISMYGIRWEQEVQQKDHRLQRRKRNLDARREAWVREHGHRPDVKLHYLYY